jgi:hypothetical protein
MHYLIQKHAKPSRQPRGQAPWGLYVVHPDKVLMDQIGRFKTLASAKAHADLLAGRTVKVLVEVA